MRLLIGLTGTAMVALAAIAAPTSPAGAAPSASAPAEIHASPPAAHASVDAPAMVAPHHRPVVEHYVDINSASRKELMTLPGIGAKEAHQIIANRPYLTKTELVTKGVLPVGPFLSLRDFVVAIPPKTAPQGRK